MSSQRITNLLLIALSVNIFLSCGNNQENEPSTAHFKIVEDKNSETLAVFRIGGSDPVLTQNAQSGMRPYLHPIMAPDGNGSLTEFSPGHHKHQTGLYWGFTRVNGSGAPADTLKRWFYDRNKPPHIKEMIGRDYFHFNGESHWKKVSATIIQGEGEEVKWQTVYQMLDESGQPILEETMNWSMTEKDQKFLLSLEWNGKALQDITVNEFSYGGMFLRMPWQKDIQGEVVNAARQRNQQAEGQRSYWVDAGMEIEGRDDWGHIAIFDHPQNAEYPSPWRVDGQLGIGPCRAINGDWQIEKGQTEVIKHQLVAYTGKLNDIEMDDLWKEYIGDDSQYVTAVLWGLAQKEGMEAKFLNPEEAVKAMTIKEGFTVNAWAAEPMITQPMAFCWDDKGRMWVAENRDYENRQEGFFQ